MKYSVILYVTDLCPFIRPAELGGLITLRPIRNRPPHLPVQNPTLDCIWQIKVPPEAYTFSWKVYVRFTEIDFDGKSDSGQTSHYTPGSHHASHL